MALLKKIGFRTILSVILFTTIFMNGCATASKKTIFEKKPKTQVLENIKHKSPIKVIPSSEVIIAKIDQFRKALNKKNLTEQDWKLHDELLEYYSELKNRKVTKVTIPAKTKIIIPIETYCLNPDRAVPNSKEIYSWRKSNPGIKYYSELLKLRRNRNINQFDLQELIWNLENETRWEAYPNKQKAILQKIDPNASINLPSSLKDKGIDLVKDQLFSFSGVGEALNSYELIKGKYYELSDLKQSIEGLTSKYDLEDYDNLTKIPGTDIYSQSESQGYSSQEVTFYNTTGSDQELDLTQYYLEPERDDVQRIGINPKIPEDPDLLNDLENLLYESMFRIGVGFTPGINDATDLYELFTGKDFLTGNNLSAFERSLSGVGVIAGSGQGYRYANRVLNAPAKYLPEFEKSIEKATGKVSSSIGKEESKTAAQASSRKIAKISNFSELKKAVGLMRRDDIVGAKRREVIEAFESGSKVTVLTDNTKIFRYWQEGVTNERGHWATTLETNNPVRDLALPETGVYKKSEWIIPKGTEVIEGLAAPKFGRPGGGPQIWISKPGILKQ